MFKKLFQRQKHAKPSPPVGLSDSVQVDLILSGGDHVDGELLCISSEGAVVRFPVNKIADLSLNESVQLEFTPLSEPTAHLRADARVNAVFEIGKKRHCQFFFAEPCKFMESLPSSFRNQFVREKTCGKLVDPHAPIKVELTWEGGCGTAQIIHITTTGMILGVEPELADAMACPDRITLRFTLPTRDAPLKLVGRISYRMAHGKHSEYGVTFDWNWDETHDFEQQESAIAVYLISLHNR